VKKPAWPFAHGRDKAIAAPAVVSEEEQPRVADIGVPVDVDLVLQRLPANPRRHSIVLIFQFHDENGIQNIIF
jgi:hypothetical protein